MAGVLALCRRWQAEDNRNTLRRAKRRRRDFPAPLAETGFSCTRAEIAAEARSRAWQQSGISPELAATAPPAFFFFAFFLPYTA